jgi:alpha-1,4-digalacturonate transport system substrate-binding protein
MTRKTLHLILTFAHACIVMLSLTGVFSARAQSAVELRILWYNDGNESEVMGELLKKFEAQNPNIKVKLDVIAYAELHNILQANIEAGNAPDMAAITDLGRFQGKYLDLTPLVKDAKYWQENFPTLDWLRVPGGKDQGIYGFPRIVTTSGPFVNATLFEQAGVKIPDDGKTTWEEWTKIAKEVAEKTKTPYAVAIDRSGHRSYGGAMSYGAVLLDPKTGRFTVDSPGFRKWAEIFLGWHKDNITPKEVWVGGGGTYKAAKDYFVNGELVFYYSGAWQIAAFTKEIPKDKFEWKAVPQPCGTDACTGMPGGTMIIALAGTKYPKETALVMDFMASEEVLGEFSGKALVVPGHAGLVKKGIKYPASQETFDMFVSHLPKLTDQSYLLQGHPIQPVLNTEWRDQMGRVLAGEITLDEAIKRIQAKVDEACDANKEKCAPIAAK